MFQCLGLSQTDLPMVFAVFLLTAILKASSGVLKARGVFTGRSIHACPDTLSTLGSALS